jgi:phage tail-like protein
MKRDDILTLLPEVFRRTAEPGEPLALLLEVMEQLHAPAEHVLANLDAELDPIRARDTFVPMLARWIDVPEARAVGLGATRELVAGAVPIARRRGTRGALVRYLEIATGVTGFDVRESVARDFHIEVVVPAAARPQTERIHAIVRDEKPAYVTYELVEAAAP